MVRSVTIVSSSNTQPRSKPTARALRPRVPPLGQRTLTFCFLRRITFTPSTDTTMLTFFFLMFLALNSY